ncbi:DUF6414 family protein [Actinotalea subterranea]|uniref:DUF6414 family protein n=1 Tax=Actinotalea subterranea TaxID=2607497 RepID=UPI0011F03500|nr:hypothetical protein [Actinotalea subterranea]
MALRSPIFLDYETLLAHAEYHDVDVPRQAEVVEKVSRQRSLAGKAGLSGLGASGGVGSDVEYQSTYRLTPNLKATVSRVIDALIHEGGVKVGPDSETRLGRDDLVELTGRTRITTASLAGKLLHIVRRVLADAELDVTQLDDLRADAPQMLAELKAVYLRNELPPIPILLEMTGTALPQRVYVSVRPDHFVDAAGANRLEGELRALGTVSHLVEGGDDGFLSAETWLLDGFEYLVKRKLMASIGDQVKSLATVLDLDLPADDVHAYITGPAIIVDAIALY